MASGKFQDFLINIAQMTAARFQSLRQRTFSWFLSEAMAVRHETLIHGPSVEPGEVIQEGFMTLGNSNLRFDIGKMVLFKYDPKWKHKLEYYDIYPLIFPIEFYNNGFLGINLHYLPPPSRAVLMDSLYTLLVEKSDISPEDRLNISYQILKGSTRYKNFWPCIKRYLYSHVRSQWSIIPVERWEMVLMLPLARFQKAGEAKVWNDSLRIIRNK